jgi:hypothetical protein
MSFICDCCLTPLGNGTKPIRRVLETREKHYPTRFAQDGKTVIDRGGIGREIVREVSLCKKCNEGR